MAINDSDRLLINDGSKTETITISQIRDGSMLNDTDLFLINDGSKTETITWRQLSDEIGPVGQVNTPIVLKPSDGTGSGEIHVLKSAKITGVQDVGGGLVVLSVDDNTDLDSFQDFTGSEIYMTDGTTEPSGEYTESTYDLKTSKITDVNNGDPNAIVLTFEDPCPDLKYFQPDDVVGVKTDITGTIVGPGNPVKINWRRPSYNHKPNTFANALWSKNKW